MKRSKTRAKKDLPESTDVINIVNDSKEDNAEPLSKRTRGKPKLIADESNSKKGVQKKTMKNESNNDIDDNSTEPKPSRGRASKLQKNKLDAKRENETIDNDDINDSNQPQPGRSSGRLSKTKNSKIIEEKTEKSKINDVQDSEDAVAPKRSRGSLANSKKIKLEEVDTNDNKMNGKAIKVKKEKKDEKEVKQLKRKLTVKQEVESDDGEDESPPKRSKGKQKIKKEKMEVDDAEANSDQKDKKKLDEDKKAPKKSAAKKSSKVKTEPKKKALERSVVKKGAAAVDGLCPIAATSHVFAENEDVWDCMLNQTNIQFNNNKYYIIQLLKDDNKETFSVWMRWGRVGCPGQNSLKPFAGNLDNAKAAFKKKFSDKTKNDWEEREAFEKVAGKYDLLKMDYSGQDETDNIKKEKEDEIKPRKKVESKLDAQVKALIELICDVKAMEEAVIEMKYDAKKAPLGKLTVDQVKAGYAALKKIESIILGSGKPSNKDLVEACNAFYTRIPHYFGMKVPPLIRTKSEIQEKLNLLQALGDIQAAMKVINQPLDDNIHPVDQQYEGLGCDLHILDKKETLYQTLEKYLLSTHGKTHSMYKMKVLEIFEANKSNEANRFKDVGNKMLLWHGSRLTNWAGILSQGLRIAPPEAPSTGYMFGKGIYFADMASKSANYCMPSYQNNIGILVLCDVSLGKSNELVNADYQAHKLPKGCQSVKGLGRVGPDAKNHLTLEDGVILPMGPGVETKAENKNGLTLQYNEFIVYDVSQVKIKYLMKVEFTFR